jgi:hypothetical protein
MRKKYSLNLFAALTLLATLASASAQVLIYDNTITSAGGSFYNGGATTIAGNTITRLVADDITPLSGYAGQTVANIWFSVANNNSVAVSARPRLRIWDGTGAGGGPGNVLAGYTFNPISFAASTSSGFYFNPGTLTVPSGTFWMGLTFDDNTGATGATAAQLDNLGMSLFNPPSIGTSADVFFQTTAAGSFLVSNPAGTLSNFGGNPPANFYFGLQVVPEPSTMALVGLGISFLCLRRRK